MATRKTPFRGDGPTRVRLIFAAILVLIVAAGIILTGAIQRAMWRDFEADGRNEAALLYGQLMTAVKEVDHSVLNMSETPLVKGALTSDRLPERDRANAVLDRYQKTMDVSVCYLMDTRGLTVASSNRMAADSFVGKSFTFRPYFSEAIAGGPGSYFARGSVSNKRGYYASAPVRDAAGRIIGVAVVKDELDELEEEFHRLPHSFLVSPDGIVFLASEPTLTFRSLWPAAPGVREKLAASQQFGTLDFAPVLQREPADASHLKYDGDTHYVFRLPLPLPGWSIVHLKDESTLARYRLFGVLTTVFVCALALLGYLALAQAEQRRHLAEERLREEALWGRTFDAVGDLIAIIGPDHRIRRVNKAMALRLGMEPADVVGRHCYELVHGTDGPIDICPHQAALKTGVQATIEAAVPRIGGEFTVTASPLLGPDGTVEGSVHIMHDITERKKSERALVERVQLQELSADVGAIWMKGADLPVSLQACAETVVAHLDAAFARIWLLNQEEAVLELKVLPERVWVTTTGSGWVRMGNRHQAVIRRESSR
ncbi:MAG: PAS domain-containing protein, partial [Candidatus Methylomirabilia bacterium]